MNPPVTCPSCGNALRIGRLRGLCPRCLLRATSSGTEASGPDRGEPEIWSGFSLPGHDNLRELARGGMGIVYQARQLAPEREVAVKMLLPQAITDEMRGRFRLEARTMGDLNHPGILPLHQFGEWAGVPYFTMKLAAGGTLASRRSLYQGQWRKVAALLAALADAVAHAHDHGVLHRDLKPGNILFDEAERAYVADFGLVKIANTDSHLTRSVALLGTPHYLAPEVAARDARAATVRSDLYSLGAVLYELLAQRPPFEAEGLPALLRCIAETEPDPLHKSGVPRDLATIAHTCLAKDPARRYETMAAMAADLRAWLAGEAIAARPVPVWEQAWRQVRRHPALTLLTLLLPAFVLTGLVMQHRANLTLRQTAAEALAAQVHAIRQGGQWDLRAAGLAAARDAAASGNRLDLRNDAITLLASPGCQETARRPFHQGSWAALMSGQDRYVDLEPGGLVLHSWTGGQPDEPIPTPEGSPPALQAMTFSSDDRALLVSFPGTSYRIWQCQEKSWAPIRYENVWGLVFSPDSRLIAYSRMESSAVVLEEWRHPGTTRTLASQFSTPAPLSFSPDGKWLAVGEGNSGTLEIFDVAAGKLLHRLENPSWNSPLFPAIAWRPDGKAFALATSLPDLIIWYLDGLHPFQRHLAGHHSEVQGVAWHPGGEWLATVSFDNTMRLWEASSGRSGLILPGSGSFVKFSASGQDLFLHDQHRVELVRYRINVPDVVRQVALPRRSPEESAQRGPWGVDLAPDGRLAVVGGTLGTYLLDAADGRLLASFKTGVVNAVNFTPDGGSFYLSLPGRGLYQSHLAPTGEGFWSLTVPDRLYAITGSISRIAQNQTDGRLALVNDGNLELLAPGQPAVKLPLPGVTMNPVAQSPDGRWAVTASYEQPAEPAAVWDLTTRTMVRRLPTLGCYMVFSPDSRTLYTASVEGPAAWDTTAPDPAAWTPRWARPNPGQIQFYSFPALSGDGHTLAIARLTHGVDLFNPATGELLATIDHPDARAIGWLALDAAGTRLVVNGTQHNIQLWDLRKLRQELATLQLDWPAPPLPPAPEPAPIKAVLTVPSLPSLLRQLK